MRAPYREPASPLTAGEAAFEEISEGMVFESDEMRRVGLHFFMAGWHAHAADELGRRANDLLGRVQQPEGKVKS